MSPKYVLMFWPQENKYSIVKRKSIITAYQDEELLGKDVNCLIAGESFSGTVFSIGTKAQMKVAENAAEKEAQDNSIDLGELESVLGNGDGDPVEVDNLNVMDFRPPKRPTVAADQDELEQVDDNPVDISGGTERILAGADVVPIQGINAEQLLREKNHLIRKLEERNSRLESENRRMKKATKVVAAGEKDERMLDIGEGLSLPESYISFLKLSFGRKPSRFFRELIFRSELFRIEDVAASSLTGKPKKDAPPGCTPIEPQVFEALIRFTTEACGIKPMSWELARFREQIKCVCGDARKGIKRKATETNI